MVLGEVEVFPLENLEDARKQATKILEEAAEVFSAVEKGDDIKTIDECCDVIMATCNLIHLLGVYNLKPWMLKCETRQKQRGRYDISKHGKI